MGRIKTKLVKRATLELFRDYKDRFKDSFEENKKIVSELVNIPSKKIRNTIAGYITRIKQQ